MAYNANIPQNNDLINVSAAQMLENFTQINNVFAVNHATFDTANAGMHNFLQMPAQGGDPATAIQEGALYTKVGALSGLVELFFRREADGPVVNITQSLGPTSYLNPGYFYVGNVLVKFGTTLAAAPGGIYALTFATGADIPVFATSPIVFVTQIGTVVGQTYILTATPVTTLGFEINKVATGAAINIPYFAIGT